MICMVWYCGQLMLQRASRVTASFRCRCFEFSSRLGACLYPNVQTDVPCFRGQGDYGAGILPYGNVERTPSDSFWVLDFYHRVWYTQYPR